MDLSFFDLLQSPEKYVFVWKDGELHVAAKS